MEDMNVVRNSTIKGKIVSILQPTSAEVEGIIGLPLAAADSGSLLKQKRVISYALGLNRRQMEKRFSA